MDTRLTRTSYRPARAAGLLLALAAAGGAVTLTGCVVREQTVVHPTAHAVAAPRVVRPMPGPVLEERGTPPGPGFNYVPGHWTWEGRDWAWVHGQWVRQAVAPMPPVVVEQITVAPSAAHAWVPGHWVWRPDGWVWVRGQWRVV